MSLTKLSGHNIITEDVGEILGEDTVLVEGMENILKFMAG